MAKGPRSRTGRCFEGRGETLEDAVANAIKRAERERIRKPVVFDVQVKVILANPLTDYIVFLTPGP